MSGQPREDPMLNTILSYKSLAEDPLKHNLMIKDKTVVQFLAYTLDSHHEEVVETALKTLELLIENNGNLPAIRSTFGVIESLKATSERTDIRDELTKLANKLQVELESPPPAYSTRSRTRIKNSIQNEPKLCYPKFSSKVYVFHVFGLNNDSRSDLENVIIRIPGIISITVDVDHQRCTVRAGEKATPEIIAEMVLERTRLEASQVILNKYGQEVLKDLLAHCRKAAQEDKPNLSISFLSSSDENDLPPYLTEEDSPVKEHAILTFDKIRSSATSLIVKAAEFFQNSFYW